MKNRTALSVVAAVTILTFGLPVVQMDQEVAAQDQTLVQRFPVLDLIIVVDQSGSMYLWSDPQGAPCVDQEGHIEYDQDGRPKICDPSYPKPMRQTAAQYMIDYLGIEPPGEPRVGVVYFGTTANIEKPLFNITDKESREEAIEFLESFPEGSRESPYYAWTNTNAMFEAVYRELFESERAAPDRWPVVVLLTDGHPDQNWSEVDKEQYYSEHKDLVQKFKEKNVPVFTVVIALTDLVSEEDEHLRNDPELVSYENIWRHIAAETGGGYYRVREEADPELRRRELLDIYHAILARLRGASRRGQIDGECTPGERRTVSIAVEECGSVVIEVQRPTPQTEVTLVAPSGQEFAPEQQRDEYLLYRVESPEEGDWTVVLEGCLGRYYISHDCLEEGLVCTLIQPSASHPQCQEMGIIAELRNEAGGPVDDGWVDVTVTLPDGGAQNVSLDHVGTGRYEAAFKSTEQRGEYKLGLTGYSAEKDKQAGYEQIVSVLERPFLESVEPILKREGPPEPVQQDQDGNVMVKAALKVGCETTRDPMLIGATSVRATLSDASGNVVGFADLQDEGREPDQTEVDGVFSGLVRASGEGEHTVTIEMMNSALNAQDTISGLVYVGPPLEPTCHCELGFRDNDLGQWRPLETVPIALSLDCQGCEKGETIGVVLAGVPFHLNTARVDVPPGRVAFDPGLTFPIPKDLDPKRAGESSHTYEGTLQITLPDGKTKEFPIKVEVLPPPISPWIFLLTALVLVIVGGVVVVAYRYRAGVGQLTGKIVYDATPPNAGTMPDEELVGGKHVIVLDEFPDISAIGAPPLWDFGHTTHEEVMPDLMAFDEPPAETAQSLHTELMFTAQRGRTEARVEVADTNGRVNVNDVPLLKGDAPLLLRDGDTISLGSYTLRYESLSRAELERAYDYEEPVWDDDEDEDFAFGERSYGDFEGYDGGGYGADTEWDGPGGGGSDDSHTY